MQAAPRKLKSKFVISRIASLLYGFGRARSLDVDITEEEHKEGMQYLKEVEVHRCVQLSWCAVLLVRLPARLAGCPPAHLTVCLLDWLLIWPTACPPPAQHLPYSRVTGCPCTFRETSSPPPIRPHG